jgi:hypothetical protein
VSIFCRVQLRFRRAIVVALLLHLLAILALASAPGWHEQLHHDAGDEGHECAITLFATGGCDAPTIAPITVGAPLVWIAAAQPGFDVEVPILYLIGQPAERGPPAIKG